jgi:hypothetical protein
MPKPKVSKKQAIQQFAKALADPTLPRRVGNAIAQQNPRTAVMGGSTRLPISHPKAKSLVGGRKLNLQNKSQFIKE